MIEYTAMIYKQGRNRGFIANCLVKNLMGFGKTEQDAIKNLKDCIEKITKMDANIKPLHNFSLLQ